MEKTMIGHIRSGIAGRFALATMVMAAFLSASTFGQSEQELRQENQALKAQAQQLEAELTAARAQLEQLTKANEALAAQVRELRRGVRQTTPPDPQPAEQPDVAVTIDESIPNASPRALFNAASESYRQSMEDFGDVTTADDRERISAMRALEKWAANANRDLKSQIEWHVRPRDIDQLRTSQVLAVTAVDPSTGAALGDSFELALTDAQITRLRRAAQRQAHDVLIVRGVLTPRIRINDQRATEGPFNNPPLIGPFAEFGFEVEPHSIVPAPPSANSDAGNRQDPSVPAAGAGQPRPNTQEGK